MINKVDACCRTTAGFTSDIHAVPAPEPKVDPKQLIKMTIETYTKTVDDLLNQGYPKVMADKVAKQYMLGK